MIKNIILERLYSCKCGSYSYINEYRPNSNIVYVQPSCYFCGNVDIHVMSGNWEKSFSILRHLYEQELLAGEKRKKSEKKYETKINPVSKERKHENGKRNSLSGR